MFGWEHVIALYGRKWNRASSRGEGDVSWVFSICGRNLGYILKLRQGLPFETRVCSAKSGLLSSKYGHLRNLNEAWQYNTDTSGCEARDQSSLSSCHSDIGITINFQQESGIIIF